MTPSCIVEFKRMVQRAVKQYRKSWETWRTDTWLLRFNAAKCKCTHLWHDSHSPETTYTLGGAEIATATEEKYLEVHLTNDCKPSLQAMYEVSSKSDVQSQSYEENLRTHPQRKLPHPVQGIHSPSYRILCQGMEPLPSELHQDHEKIQRRANWPYMVRLKELKLYPFIAIRRLRGDMIEVFKIMNGARLVAMKPVHLFKMSHNAQTSGNRFKFFKKPLKKITTPCELETEPPISLIGTIV